MEGGNDQILIGHRFVDGDQGISNGFGMAEVVIGRLGAFVEIQELHYEIGCTGHRLLGKVTLKTVPNLLGSVIANGKLCNVFCESGGEGTDDQLICCIPFFICRIGFLGGDLARSGGEKTRRSWFGPINVAPELIPFEIRLELAKPNEIVCLVEFDEASSIGRRIGGGGGSHERGRKDRKTRKTERIEDTPTKRVLHQENSGSGVLSDRS